MYSKPKQGCAPVPIAVHTLRVYASDMAVRAGFPSPADDAKVDRLDVSKLLVQHPQASFLLRASGVSMQDLGINDQDLLLVDRALTAQHGDIVVAEIDGEFTVKQLYHLHGQVKLLAGNKTYPASVPKEGQNLSIFGVVTWAITAMHRAGYVRAGRCQ